MGDRDRNCKGYGTQKECRREAGRGGGRMESRRDRVGLQGELGKGTF
jgi:hypothetical protein